MQVWKLNALQEREIPRGWTRVKNVVDSEEKRKEQDTASACHLVTFTSTKAILTPNSGILHRVDAMLKRHL
jgi:hypothetical protein